VTDRVRRVLVAVWMTDIDGLEKTLNTEIPEVSAAVLLSRTVNGELTAGVAVSSDAEQLADQAERRHLVRRLYGTRALSLPRRCNGSRLTVAVCRLAVAVG
jgi:hypothetical protein